MGFFSWKTADTKQSIWNVYTKKHRPVYLLLPEGRPSISERAYEGYGEFGGVDAYELLARENGLGDNRESGIELAFDDSAYEKAKFHLKFSFNENAKYEDLPPSERDPNQGYFDVE